MQYDLRTLDKAQGILNRAGIDDNLIRNGVALRPSGYQRLARALDMSPHDAKDVYLQLIAHVRDSEIEEEYGRFMEDGDRRYGYEKDFLGNVTIRDTITGDDRFLTGDESSQFLALIDSGGDEEAICAKFMTMDEDLNEDEETVEDGTYDKEIASQAGTYNFPWKIKGDRGFATAQYGGSDDPKSMRIMGVSNFQGDTIKQLSPEFENELKKQAIAFIGDA